MAKKLHLVHVKSSVADKAPSASTIEYGEIAVNYNSETPALYIRDDEDNVVKFISEPYFEKIVGTGITENDGETITPLTEVIEQDEMTVSAALNDLNDRKADKSELADAVSGLTEQLSDYMPKSGGTFTGAVDFDNTLNVNDVLYLNGADAYFNGGTLDMSDSSRLGHIVGLAYPEDDEDAATKGYVDEQLSEKDIWEKGEGENSAVLKGSNGTAFGANSVVEGTSVTNAVSRGITTASTDEAIITEWSGSTPDTDKFSLAKGEASHVEGNNNIALGKNSHAEGNGNVSSNDSSHAEGTGTYATGKRAHAEGIETTASGNNSHSEGKSSIAAGESSHAEGQSETTSAAKYAHAEGYHTYVSGKYAHAEGEYTQATAQNAHAEGAGGDINGVRYGVASAYGSHAEGKTIASGEYSHAEGYQSKATGLRSHAEGYNTQATKQCAHAEGAETEASGQYSHTEGYKTIATNDEEHAEGKYNVSNSGSTDAEKTIHSVGIGTSSQRKNAFEIMQNGDIYVYGLGGYSGTSITGVDTLQEVINSSAKDSSKTETLHLSSSSLESDVFFGPYSGDAQYIFTLENIGDPQTYVAVVTDSVEGGNVIDLKGNIPEQIEYDKIETSDGSYARINFHQLMSYTFDTRVTVSNLTGREVNLYESESDLPGQITSSAASYYEKTSGSADFDILIDTTYDELVSLRDSGNLIPGASYRITDYQTTTTFPDTTSAGHRFDVVVTALSESTLSEDARAMHHDGDTYFIDSDVEAWKLKYSLDNDNMINSWAGTALSGDAIYFCLPESDFLTDAKLYRNALSNDNEKSIFLIPQSGNEFTISGKTYGVAISKYIYPLETHTARIRGGICIEEGTHDGQTCIILNNTYVPDASTRESFISSMSVLGADSGTCETLAQNIESQFGTDWPKKICILNPQEETEYIPFTNDTWSTIDFESEESLMFSSYFLSAEVSKGYGVIWYMEDENGNSAYHDFKNIMVKKNTSDDVSMNVDNGYRYMFSFVDEGGDLLDATVRNGVKEFYTPSHDNKVGRCDYISNLLQKIAMMVIEANNIPVFQPFVINTSYFICTAQSELPWGNDLGFGATNCYSLNGYENKLGDYCFGNVFLHSFANTIGTKSFMNVFENSYDNEIKMGCYGNGFKNAWNNDLNDGCYGITIGSASTGTNDTSYGNVFGNNCRSIVLGKDARYNEFAGGCENNTLGRSAYNNTFGAYATNNTVPDVCKYVHFGAQCHDITLQRNYTRYVTFEDNCAFINLTSVSATTTSRHIQNLTVYKGFNGGSTGTVQTITIQHMENKYPIVYGYDSSLQGREFNVPDLANYVQYIPQIAEAVGALQDRVEELPYLGSGYTYTGIPYVTSSTTIADAYSALTYEMLLDEETLAAALNQHEDKIGELSGATTTLASEVSELYDAVEEADKVFLCTYGVTTIADIKSAYSSGKAIFVKYTDNVNNVVVTVPLAVYMEQGGQTMVIFQGVYEMGMISITITSINGWQQPVLMRMTDNITSASTSLDIPTAYGVYQTINAIHSVPSGGTSGQVLKKASNTNYDVEWANGGGGATIITNDGSDGDSVAIKLTDNQSYQRSFRIDMTAEYSGYSNAQRIGSLLMECRYDADIIAHGYYYGDDMSDILTEVAVYQDDTDTDTFYLMLRHNSDNDSITYAITPLDDGDVEAIITNAADDHSKSDDAVITQAELTSNKVTSISSSSTNTEYPTAKAVYDLVGDIETLLSQI